ncbi:aldo/keto reductase family oxidoreductase [Nereida sp. NH-UV-3]|uniref:aldo/keto reductase n=1 Tax=Nereida TaxID=282198 RepID=UPI0036F1ED55
MDRIQITDDLSFSQIIYGMWRLGDDTDTSQSHVQAKVEACLAQGITTMDQADIYGGYTAEALFGETLKAAPALRDQIEIVTKCDIVAPVGRHSGARVKYYDTSAAHITASVEASLRDMNIDVIDCLLIHRPDPLMDAMETGEVLDDLIASGKVRTVGVSNFKPWDFSLLQSAMENELVANQIELSATNHTPFTDGDLAFLQENDIPVMAWSPLGGGSIFDNAAVMNVLNRVAGEAGVEPSAVAVAFLLRHPARIAPVMGTNNISRINALSDALKVKLDRQTWFEIYTAALGREVA